MHELTPIIQNNHSISEKDEQRGYAPAGIAQHLDLVDHRHIHALREARHLHRAGGVPRACRLVLLLPCARAPMMQASTHHARAKESYDTLAMSTVQAVCCARAGWCHSRPVDDNHVSFTCLHSHSFLATISSVLGSYRDSTYNNELAACLLRQRRVTATSVSSYSTAYRCSREAADLLLGCTARPLS